MDNVNVGGKGFDDVQEEILAAMKDSGVLDEWKDKLDDMLYNDVDTDNKNEKKEAKKPVSNINEQEREMLRNFIDKSLDMGQLLDIIFTIFAWKFLDLSKKSQNIFGIWQF